MIKNIPHFLKLIKTRDILNIKIISSYFLINIISVFISLWIISRMIIISNYGDLYLLFLVVGLFLSLYLFYKYNKNITELNYNIKSYPLWMVSILTIIILIVWILIPISVIKIMDNYTVVLERYNIYLKNELINNMSPDLGQNLRDNASEITVREEVNENLTARSASKSISDSNKNAVSSSSRASSSRGGYAIGEATSETAGKAEISVTVSPEDGSNTSTNTNPFSTINDSDSNFLSSSTKTKGKLLLSNKPLDILSMFREEATFSPVEIEKVDKISVDIEEIRPLIIQESNINTDKQLSKTIVNFKSKLALAKEKSDFTKISGPRILDEVNIVNIFIQYYNLKGIILPEKSLLNYYNNHPWLPKYSKNGMCKYMFMMNITNNKMIELSNLIRELREDYYTLNLELEILELIVKEYNDLIYLLKNPGYLEKLYRFYNQLDIIIDLDNDTKVVNKDNLDSITRLRYNRRITPIAKVWLVWNNSVVNYSEQTYSLSDLEIRFLYDLYKLKSFLSNGLEYYYNYPISLSEFKELSNNLALKLLMSWQSENSGIYQENLGNIFKILDIEVDEINWSILEFINNNFTGEEECRILRDKDYIKYKSSLNNSKEYGMLRPLKSMTDISQSGNISKHKNTPFKTLKKAASFFINKK